MGTGGGLSVSHEDRLLTIMKSGRARGPGKRAVLLASLHAIPIPQTNHCSRWKRHPSRLFPRYLLHHKAPCMDMDTTADSLAARVWAASA